VYARINALLNMETAANYRVHSVIATIPGIDGVADVALDRQVIDLKGVSVPVATLAQMASPLLLAGTVSAGSWRALPLIGMQPIPQAPPSLLRLLVD